MMAVVRNVVAVAAVASAAVGIARRSIDEVVGLATTKKPQGSTRTLAERAATQAEVATAEARLAAAWSMMLDAAVGLAKLVKDQTNMTWDNTQQVQNTLIF